VSVAESQKSDGNNLMEKIASLCKRRGFIFPGSEIYGGLGGTWDYGPLGVELKNNIRKQWWKRFVQEKSEVVGIEGCVLMNPRVWEASGHLASFYDILVECKNCHARFRADHMKAGEYVGQGKAKKPNQCPECGGEDFTEPKEFNLMFQTYVGPVADEAHKTYLRPETAQSMFTNFKFLVESMRLKVPFGVAQTGRCFRNEITTGNYIFRSREFDIAEIEFFVKPGADDKWFEIWLNEWQKFFIDLGLKKENTRLYEHPKESLAHYSKRTVDIEYKFPFGWQELAGVANRTDFDLKQHMKYSGKDLEYFDAETKEKYIPYVIEPTLGVDRALLAFLVDAYEEVKGGRTKTTESTKETEVVLHLHKNLAPIKIAVLPLVKKEPLVKLAKEIYQSLLPNWMVQYDEVASIGRRYRRQDEIGTPYCVTVDFQSLEDKTVTVRDRDTMEQERILISDLINYFKEKNL
jgi:glycyl-tRNA synthetase